MLSFFPRDVLDEILDLIESVSEGFPSYSLHIMHNTRILLCCFRRDMAFFMKMCHENPIL